MVLSALQFGNFYHSLKYIFFQTAAKKRSRRHLLETDEYIASNNEANRMDVVGFSTAYQKMRTLCFNIRNEIFTDIEIHNQHVLPRLVNYSFLSFFSITSTCVSGNYTLSNF